MLDFLTSAHRPITLLSNPFQDKHLTRSLEMKGKEIEQLKRRIIETEMRVLAQDNELENARNKVRKAEKVLKTRDENGRLNATLRSEIADQRLELFQAKKKQTVLEEQVNSLYLKTHTERPLRPGLKGARWMK